MKKNPANIEEECKYQMIEPIDPHNQLTFSFNELMTVYNMLMIDKLHSQQQNKFVKRSIMQLAYQATTMMPVKNSTRKQ